MKLFGRQNQNGSFSTSATLGELQQVAFVDYLDETTGLGYQRFEKGTITRGKQISKYIGLCRDHHVQPELFDIKANARLGEAYGTAQPKVTFLKVNGKESNLCVIELPDPEFNNAGDRVSDPYIAIFDGGTRFVGYNVAKMADQINKDYEVDLMLYIGLTVPQEALRFELINSRQKLVRTDLSDRVIQNVITQVGDIDGETPIEELTVEQRELATLDVSRGWKFVAHRLAARINTDETSIWHDQITMPTVMGMEEKPDPVTGRIMPVTPEPRVCRLQSFAASLKPVLTSKWADEAGGDAENVAYSIIHAAWQGLAANLPEAVKTENEQNKSFALMQGTGVTAVHHMLAEFSQYLFDHEEEPGTALATLTDPEQMATFFSAAPRLNEDGYWYRKSDGRFGTQTTSGKGQPGEGSQYIGKQAIDHGKMLWTSLKNVLEPEAQTEAELIGAKGGRVPSAS